MKKLKNIIAIILLLVSIFAIQASVKAADTTTQTTWSDPAKVKLSIEEINGAYFLKVSGLQETTAGDGTFCKAFIANGSAPKITYAENGEPEGISVYPSSVTRGQNMSIYFEKAGDVYITIVERSKLPVNGKYETKTIINGQKIERPAQKVLGKRIYGNFSDKGSSVSILDPMYSPTSGATVNVKVGRVTDKNILKAIKNKESGALSNLLNYAKKSESVYTGKLKALATTQEAITKNMSLTDKAYYFVYLSIGGEYYPLEDVSLYQALVGEGVGKNLYDYLDDKFKWEIGDDEQSGEVTTPEQKPSENKPAQGETKKPEQQPEQKPTSKPEETKKDNTTIKGKLPQTGQSIGIVMAIGTLAIAGTVFFVKSKKYRD